LDIPSVVLKEGISSHGDTKQISLIIEKYEISGKQK
jgi:hypothetical protein